MLSAAVRLRIAFATLAVLSVCATVLWALRVNEGAVYFAGGATLALPVVLDLVRAARRIRRDSDHPGAP